MDSKAPVVIVGAGVVGLALGQALKKQNIPFIILERDHAPTARGQGWAITIHWALPYMQQFLPSDVLSRIEACQVDPDVAVHDTGNFLFLNLEDSSVKFKIAPSKRWRVKREKMRLALLQGIEEHVHWDKRVVGISRPTAENPMAEVECAEGSTFRARIVVGVEGNNSMVRRTLRPDAHQTNQLPIRFTGVAVALTPEQAKPLRELDPLLFQGCHPETGTFFWYSTLETPASNGTEHSEKPRYLAQINMSWPVKGPEDEVKTTDEERLANMKRRAQCLAPVFERAVTEIPDDTSVLEIKLADWECLDWDNAGGSLTMAGDAAHAMTMYRGEAANHGLLDAYHLSRALKDIFDGVSQKATIDAYESEMRKRTQVAVRLSRQACIDAHNWENLNENSAVLTKRAIPNV
ncbi:hypothetical protein MBLNU459_g7047t1 [Dothideomycetes sp. NU459]